PSPRSQRPTTFAGESTSAGPGGTYGGGGRRPARRGRRGLGGGRRGSTPSHGGRGWRRAAALAGGGEVAVPASGCHALAVGAPGPGYAVAAEKAVLVATI